jgi:hypothetical protein
MRNRRLVVFWDGSPIAAIENLPSIPTIDGLLDWYAKLYAFERRRLTGAFVDVVAYEE